MPLTRTQWRKVDVGWRIIFTLAATLALVQVYNLGRDGAEAREAICAFKLNLLLQIDSSDRWLEEHPKGAPALGISAADIRASIARQQATVRSLRIDCNLPPIPRVPPSPVPTTTTERTKP